MSQPTKANPAKPRCGLCGKTKKLVKTECCGQWICDDESNYVLFSYARNSCSRAHRRYTLCASHHSEGHKGHWKNCKLCLKSFQTEMYVWYGTNDYNFEKLENPPSFEPTLCDCCGIVIKLGTDGYSIGPSGKLCERCCNIERSSPPVVKPARPAAPRQPKVLLPANANPEAIEIILSAKAQSRWRVKPAVRASEPPAHWLGQWRVDFAQKADRSWLAMVTNVATFYTFVLPLKDLKPDSFEKLFRLRLGFALTDAPSLARWKDAPLVYAHGNPRVVVRKMSRMKLELPLNTDRDDEDWINNSISMTLRNYPSKEFASRLDSPPPENGPLLPPLDEEFNVIAESGQPFIAPPKMGRNDSCPCGSGKKFKKCCGK